MRYPNWRDWGAAVLCILVLGPRLAEAQVTDTSFAVTAENCAQVTDFSTLACPPEITGEACAAAQALKKSQCSEVTRSNFSRFLDDLLEQAEKYLFEILSAIVAVSFGFVALRVQRVADRLKKRIGDPFFARPATFENRAINVIMIGEGGSGKTTIIHALTGSDEANPEIATDAYATYSIVLEINVKKSAKETRDVYRIYVDDYVGQRFVAAIRNENLELRKKVVPASLLLIVVDLFSPDKKAKNGSNDLFDKERVKEQIEFYGDGVIQIIVDLLGNGTQIVLFINKVDMIRSDRDVERLVKTAYEPLINRLKDIRGKQVSVIVGSARTGQGIVGYNDGDSKRRSLAKVVLDTAETFDNQVAGG